MKSDPYGTNITITMGGMILQAPSRLRYVGDWVGDAMDVGGKPKERKL